MEYDQNQALTAMYEFASGLVDKYGMNGSDSMTDDEHKAWQHACGMAAVALDTPTPPAAEVLAERKNEEAHAAYMIIRIGEDYFFMDIDRNGNHNARSITRTDARLAMLEMRISPEDIAARTP